MKNRCLAAVLCIFATAGAFAQLRVELAFEQETYLPREPLYAVVTIYNSSGQTLVLGRDNEWLSFSVEPVDRFIVREKRPLKVEGEFQLPSAHRAKKRVNLEEGFDFSKIARYNVSATVKLRYGGWNEDFTSRVQQVGVSSGVTIWEQPFGLPSEVEEVRPEIRKFQLVQANHQKQLSLYVRIIGESERETVALFPLGRLVGFSRPEPQLDRWSNLHVLYQDSGHGFRYNVITPDGMLLTRQSWAISETRPALRSTTEGRIQVSGGVRRITASDLPPPDLLSQNNSLPPAVSAAQNAVDAQNTVK